MEYKGQQKENLPFIPWLKVVSLADRTKLNRAREKWSRKHEKSREEVPESDSAEIPNSGSPNLNVGHQFGSTLNKESMDMEGGLIREGHMDKGAVTADNFEGSKKKLMQSNDKKLHGAAKISDVTGMQDIQERYLLEKGKIGGNGKGNEILAGKEEKRANETHSTQMSSEEEVVDDGLKAKKSRPKWKRWKSQACDTNKKPSKAGTLVSKRLCSEVMWPSPKKKKAKTASPVKKVLVVSPTKPLSKTLKLS